MRTGVTTMELVVLSIVIWLISLLILIAVIRHAVDSSRTSRRLDDLIDEIKLLRKDIRENKAIIDKRI